MEEMPSDDDYTYADEEEAKPDRETIRLPVEIPVEKDAPYFNQTEYSAVFKSGETAKLICHVRNLKGNVTPENALVFKLIV